MVRSSVLGMVAQIKHTLCILAGRGFGESATASFWGWVGVVCRPVCGTGQGLEGASHQARQYMYKFQQHNSHQASSGDNGAAVNGGGAESVIWAPRKPDWFYQEGAGSSPGRSSGKRCP